MAEIQVDQRVELGEASEVIQLVTREVQGLDVAQVGVCGFQDSQVVVGQIHMDQTVQVLQSHRGHFVGGWQTLSLLRGQPGASLGYRMNELQKRKSWFYSNKKLNPSKVKCIMWESSNYVKRETQYKRQRN